MDNKNKEIKNNINKMLSEIFKENEMLKRNYDKALTDVVKVSKQNIELKKEITELKKQLELNDLEEHSCLDCKYQNKSDDELPCIDCKNTEIPNTKEYNSKPDNWEKANSKWVYICHFKNDKYICYVKTEEDAIKWCERNSYIAKTYYTKICTCKEVV